MAVPFFSDIYKLFYYATKPGPIEANQEDEHIEGVGVTSPDARWDIRSNMWGGAQSPMRIQTSDSNDFIDLSTVTNRKSRYKEYERLENIPEIHTALNTFADEACLSGSTKIATPMGFFTIQELAEEKDPEERFLVYCWDFEKNDFTLGWAYNPRFVREAKTVEVKFDNGMRHLVTPDHRFLMMDGTWREAGDLKHGDKLKPFYRIQADENQKKLKTLQFPRIFTYNKGWVHERQFIDEWKLDKDIDEYKRLNKIGRFIQKGLGVRQVEKAIGHYRQMIIAHLERHGFTFGEIQTLCKRYPEERTVVGVSKNRRRKVYDLSVEDHANFATDATIVHNCQTDDDGRVFKVRTENHDVKEEIEFLMHRLLELDDRSWGIQRSLCKLGDHFFELVIDPEDPKRGVIKVQSLPADSMYRIETIKGRLYEFQQSQEGPDYNALARTEITRASQAELMQATALRFHPEQIVHARIGDDRKTFYPYGISVIEAARGPAHQLRLMEDAMLVYRLTRAPERRVFYVDVGTIAPPRAEAFVDRVKDQFRKKKVYSRKRSGGPQGASAVEERWNPMGPDEDYFIPVRPNSQTRIETLPGAENLGEIDDALYFRQRLFTALQFPKNYLTNEDPQATRLTLSQQDVRFARLVERLQKPLARAYLEIAKRHLMLRGFPPDTYDDLEIRLTPPSDWRQINRNEVTEVLYGRAATVLGSQLMSKYDALVQILGYEEDEAREMVARVKAQQVDDLRLQAMGQNPEMLGLTPMAQQGTEIGAGAGGPSPMLGPPEGGPAGALPGPEGAPGGPEGALGGPEGAPPAGAGAEGSPAPEATPGSPAGGPAAAPSPETTGAGRLPKPEEEDIKKYDLEIEDAGQEVDEEEIDVGESEGDE